MQLSLHSSLVLFFRFFCASFPILLTILQRMWLLWCWMPCSKSAGRRWCSWKYHHLLNTNIYNHFESKMYIYKRRFCCFSCWLLFLILGMAERMKFRCISYILYFGNTAWASIRLGIFRSTNYLLSFMKWLIFHESTTISAIMICLLRMWFIINKKINNFIQLRHCIISL